MNLTVKPKLNEVPFGELSVTCVFLHCGKLFVKASDDVMINIEDKCLVTSNLEWDCTPVEIEEVTVRESL